MSEILLVEDDEHKRINIENALRDAGLPPPVEAKSYHSALDALIKGQFVVVLLDMTLPTFDVTPIDDGGRPQAFAGRELLRQMRRRGMTGKVLVVTQFDRFGKEEEEVTLAELSASLRREYPEHFLGSIHYDEVTGDWRRELVDVVGRTLVR